MRRVLLLVALVACRRAGETRTRPLVPLDETSPPATPVAEQPPVELPTTDQLRDMPEVEGAGPVSAPTGERIELVYVPPAEGARRIVTLTTVSSEQRGAAVQVSRYGYRFTEDVAQLTRDRIAVLRVTAHDAREAIDVDGKATTQKLLWGTYDVDLTSDFAATRDRQAVGTREQEELALVIGLDTGNEGGMHEVARRHPLRAGESILLTDAEKELYARGPAVPDPIALTLVRVDDESVTLRIDATVDRGSGQSIKHREIDRYLRATGALVEKTLDTDEIEGGVVSKNHTHETVDVSGWSKP